MNNAASRTSNGSRLKQQNRMTPPLLPTDIQAAAPIDEDKSGFHNDISDEQRLQEALQH